MVQEVREKIFLKRLCIIGHNYMSAPSIGNLEAAKIGEMASVDVIKDNVKDAYFMRRTPENCNMGLHLAARIFG